MTHTYRITGMTCDSCQSKVQDLLSKVEGVTAVNVNWQTGKATVDMEKHIPTSELQLALKDHPRYILSEKQENIPHFQEEAPKPWLQTYKPVLLIFAYVTGTSLLAQVAHTDFSWQLWMRHFMAGFFLTFSFFKLLNLHGFADGYFTYDVIAKRWRPYAYIYAFIELILGILFLTGFVPFITNILTFAVMSLSLVGVLKSVLGRRQIRCACLGDVFNLPMSTITVIEDSLMIIMSAVMILTMI